MGLSDVLEDDPLGFYLLAEPTGAVAVDSSTHDRDGVHVNDPIRLGCACSYDGEADDTELGHAGLSLSTGAGTFEAWLWMNDYNRYVVLRDHSGIPDGDTGWLLWADQSGTLGLVDTVIYRVGGVEVLTTVPIAESKNQTWQHFAVTYDAVDSRFYANGELRHVGPPCGSSPVALPWHVARNGEFEPPVLMTMRAARVAFFGAKLAADRILAHYQGGAPCQHGWVVGAVTLG